MYRTLAECIEDLEKHGHLIRIREEVDPYLQMAEIQRRVFTAAGPAIFFERVKGTEFPAVSNLFGTIERARFIFRHTLKNVKKLINLKSDPSLIFKNFTRYLSTPQAGLHAMPKKVNPSHPFHETEISNLPQIKSWPKDGGAFITLPQVFTLDPRNPHILKSNLGMYRVQLSGNDYRQDQQIGLHYQIHRGIGVHHAAAKENGQPLKVTIFVGGPPAHAFSAVMPLPEGIPELAFAGVLGGRRFRYFEKDGYILSADADFNITGIIEDNTLPEGPFGDHLGYYSLTHDFPVMKIEKVYHRPGAIWPFTVVGRPPQEDTVFGQLIHEITGPIIPQTIPGLKAVHAVDAAGVHPLLLAIGSERYAPYETRVPQELLTIANAVLGFGQMSLAKYLMIVAGEDNPRLNILDIERYIIHLLERIDWRRDLHFQTRTTMDTLDYSGIGINKGSKVVMAAAGEPTRRLAARKPKNITVPDKFSRLEKAMPGVLLLQGPAYQDKKQARIEVELLTDVLAKNEKLGGWPLIVLVDNSDFVSANFNNFLWVTFTRSDPAMDIYGVDSFIEDKHWGCGGSLIIDARVKPHHAPQLECDPQTVKSVDALAEKGKSLYGI